MSNSTRNLSLNSTTRATACTLLLLLSGGVADAGISTVNLFSPSNNRVVPFQIYTPPGYESAPPTQRYPMVISLHGIGGTSQGRANTYVNTLNARINSGAIAPMIWVFPSGQDDAFYGDSVNRGKQVYSNIIHEILPHVDANYRTIGTRNGRAMEGFSMGGFGAAMYTAKHPELFSAVLEYGGALLDWQTLTQRHASIAQEMYNSNEANWLPYSLWDQTTANAQALRTTVNYKMIVGDIDPTNDGNAQFRDHLLSLGIDPQYQVLPGVAHMGGQYLNEGSGLAFLNNHFATVPAPTTVTLALLSSVGLLRRRRAAAV